MPVVAQADSCCRPSLAFHGWWSSAAAQLVVNCIALPRQGGQFVPRGGMERRALIVLVFLLHALLARAQGEVDGLDIASPGEKVLPPMPSDINAQESANAQESRPQPSAERSSAALCKVSQWTSWAACSVSCGGIGMQSRSRSIVRMPHLADSAAGCPFMLHEQQQCVTSICPIDCAVTPWGAWSKCTRTCGSGANRYRHRIAKRNARWGGVPCPPLRQEDSCDVMLGECPPTSSTCRVSSWGMWSECSKTCDTGVQTRLRFIESGRLEAVQKQTPNCPLLEVRKYCNVKLCRDSNPAEMLAHTSGHWPARMTCRPLRWNEWSACTVTCGGGKRFRQRSVANLDSCDCNFHVKKNTFIGRAAAPTCPPLLQSKTCNPQQCPAARDCELSKWGEWGNCKGVWFNKLDGTKVDLRTQTRTRSVLVMPSGGDHCRALEQTKRCGGTTDEVQSPNGKAFKHDEFGIRVDEPCIDDCDKRKESDVDDDRVIRDHARAKMLQREKERSKVAPPEVETEIERIEEEVHEDVSSAIDVIFWFFGLIFGTASAKLAALCVLLCVLAMIFRQFNAIKDWRRRRQRIIALQEQAEDDINMIDDDDDYEDDEDDGADGAEEFTGLLEKTSDGSGSSRKKSKSRTSGLNATWKRSKLVELGADDSQIDRGRQKVFGAYKRALNAV